MNLWDRCCCGGASGLAIAGLRRGTLAINDDEGLEVAAEAESLLRLGLDLDELNRGMMWLRLEGRRHVTSISCHFF